jgi:predicted nucleic acid-binding protein
MNRLEVLVDSDAWVGLFFEDDPHHATANAAFERLSREQRMLTSTSLVVAETATVLSNRKGQLLACEFLRYIRESKIPLIHIDEKLQLEAIRLFEAQEKRGMSVVDCANVAVMKRFGISAILSFDEFYFKKLHLKQAA